MASPQLGHVGLMEEANLSIWPAMILERLSYWYRYSKLSHDEKLWVVRTLDEWGDEIGIKPKAYKLALKRLKEEGYLEVRIAPHPFKPHILRSTHYTITDRTKALLSLTRSEKAQSNNPKRPYKSGHKEPSNKPLKALSSIYTCLLPVLHLDGSAASKTEEAEPAKGDEGVLKQKSAKSVEEVFAAAKKIKVPVKIDPVRDFEKLWKAKVAQYVPTWYQVPWSSAQKVFAKQLVVKIPRDMLASAIETLISDWEGFRVFIKKMKGKNFNVPELPDLLFLLKHVESAINFAKNHGAINCKQDSTGGDADWA